MAFHRRCGSHIFLTNANRTARRNVSHFNHGLVFSADPVTDDILFEVRIDEKVIILKFLLIYLWESYDIFSLSLNLSVSL